MTDCDDRHDPLTRLGDDERLRRAARRFDAERRAEAQAYEGLLAKSVARSRTLADVAGLLFQRGDVVEIQTPTAVFRGPIVVAGYDVVVLQTPVGLVDVPLAAGPSLRSIERRNPPASPAPKSATLRARLAAYEGAGTPLRVGTTLALGDLEGCVDTVARDHVVIDAGGDRYYIALNTVTFVLVNDA